MKRFRFRLERVLDFRNTEKKERERELAERNYALRKREDELTGIIDAQDRARIPQDQVMTMAELTVTGRYQQFLRSMLENQRVLVQEAVEAVEAARDAYLEKAIETETLETLKERRQEEWRAEKKLEEKKELDELVVQRHRFGKSDGESDE